MRSLYSALFLLASSVSITGIAVAGELVPSGAPAPTMRTLQEVRPARPLTIDTTGPTVIAESGSYYLVGNVDTSLNDIVAGGIHIDADDVTLDLNGFSVGRFSNFPSLNGIEVSGTNVTIRNGTVHSNGNDGIVCTGGNEQFLRLVDVSVVGNAERGVYCYRLSMRGGHVNDNGDRGITCGTCNLTGVRVASNGNGGLFAMWRTTMTRSIVQNNQVSSMTCVLGASTVSNSIVALNAQAPGCVMQESYVSP